MKGILAIGSKTVADCMVPWEMVRVPSVCERRIMRVVDRRVILYIFAYTCTYICTHVDKPTHPLQPHTISDPITHQQVTCLPADLTLDETSLAAIRQAGFSRIPVCRPCPLASIGGGSMGGPSFHSATIQELEEGAEVVDREAVTPPRGRARSGSVGGR